MYTYKDWQKTLEEMREEGFEEIKSCIIGIKLTPRWLIEFMDEGRSNSEIKRLLKQGGIHLNVAPAGSLGPNLLQKVRDVNLDEDLYQYDGFTFWVGKHGHVAAGIRRDGKFRIAII